MSGARQRAYQQRFSYIGQRLGLTKAERAKPVVAHFHFANAAGIGAPFMRLIVFKVLQQRLLQVVSSKPLAVQPHKQFIIFAAGKGRAGLVAAAAQQYVPPKHNRGVNIGRVKQKIAPAGRHGHG